MCTRFLHWALSQMNSVRTRRCFNLRFVVIRGGADKSLARPGSKQATATKFGIYSTYSLRSSMNFLDRYSKFCKPLKKKSEGCPFNQVFAATMTSASDKNDDLSIFSVQRTGCGSMGPDPENRVGDWGNGSPGRPVCSGLQVLGEPSNAVQEQDFLG